MIKNDDTLYVTVAIDSNPDGSIGILLPGYSNRIFVLADPEEERGHSRLHGALAWLLKENGD